MDSTSLQKLLYPLYGFLRGDLMSVTFAVIEDNVVLLVFRKNGEAYRRDIRTTAEQALSAHSTMSREGGMARHIMVSSMMSDGRYMCVFPEESDL